MDRLSEAYTNTGSTTPVWEVLHHHWKGLLPLSLLSVCEGPPRVLVNVANNIMYRDVRTDRGTDLIIICPHDASRSSSSIWVYLKNSEHLFKLR